MSGFQCDGTESMPVMKLAFCFFCLALLAACGLSHADTQPHYRLIILPLQLDSGKGGINARGQIVGCAVTGDHRPVLWQQGHSLEVLDKTPGIYVNNEDTHSSDYPTAINVHGEVVGNWTYEADGAYLSSFSGSSISWPGHVTGEISGLPPSTDCSMYGINDHGEIVGSYIEDDYSPGPPNPDTNPVTTAPTIPHAFLIRYDRVHALWAGAAGAISNRDWIVGTLYAGMPPAHPAAGVLWRNGHTTRLPMQPDAINENGEIAGKVPVDDDDGKACVWRKGHVTHLSHKISNALALNNRGQVVGFIRGPVVGSQMKAVLWQYGRGYDLNSCVTRPKGYVLADAVGINDRGWIVGRGDIYRVPTDKEAYKSFTYLLIPR